MNKNEKEKLVDIASKLKYKDMSKEELVELAEDILNIVLADEPSSTWIYPYKWTFTDGGSR